jgi:hypothetical protein
MVSCFCCPKPCKCAAHHLSKWFCWGLSRDHHHHRCRCVCWTGCCMGWKLPGGAAQVASVSAMPTLSQLTCTGCSARNRKESRRTQKSKQTRKAKQ